MSMRILNLCVVVLLVIAASYVYEIKFESTLRAERVAKMRGDIRRERDAIAGLRAEWATLDNPARIQGLTRRHLTLRPPDATQFDQLKNLPERPPTVVQPPPVDTIAEKIESIEAPPQQPAANMLDANPITGSVPGKAEKR